MQAIDLTGMKFGYLTVIKRAENSAAGKARWECLCKCGRTTTVVGAHLRAGRIVSCGCFSAEKNHDLHFKHGESNSLLYRIWNSMKERCRNPNDTHYIHYGAKGVTVCSEWEDFAVFRAWAVDNGYIQGQRLSIDRIDDDGNYEPANCRWIPLSENVAKRNRLPEKLRDLIKRYALEGKSNAEIERLTGVSRQCVARIRSEAGAPTRNDKTKALYARVKEMLDEGCSVRSIAEKLDMVEGTVYSIRAKLGMSQSRKQSAAV